MLIFFSNTSASQQIQKKLRFHHLNQETGHSGGAHKIFVDSRDFLWILDYDGLSRFDGSQVSQFESGVDSTQYAGQKILSNAIEDSLGNLWFVTPEALNCYERKSGTFIKYFHNNADVALHDILLDWTSNNDILIRATGMSLSILFEAKNRKFIKLNEGDSKNAYFGSMEIGDFKIAGESTSISKYVKQPDGSIQKTILFEDTLHWKYEGHYCEKDSILWFCHDNELLRYNYVDNSIRNFDPPEEIDLSNDQKFCTWNNEFYLNTRGQGIITFNLKTLQYGKNHRHQELDPFSLGFDKCTVQTISNKGVLFCSSEFEGVTYANLSKCKFELFYTTEQAAQFGGDTFIRCMAEDKNGNVWCAFNLGNVIVFNNNKEIVKYYYRKQFFPDNISGHLDYDHLRFDKQGRAWFSTWSGIAVFDLQKNETSVIHHPGLPFNGSDNWTQTLETSEGKIIALNNNGNPYQVVEANGKFHLDILEVGKLEKRGGFFTMHEGIQNCLWLSNDTYLVHCLKTDDGFKSIKHILLNQPVKDYFDEGDSILWCASSAGLLRIRLSDYSISKFTKKDGLPDDFVYSIVPDDVGNFWLSTNKGICRFNRITLKCRNYVVADGLQGMEYNSNAFCKTNLGEIWMGGMNGINAFYPEEVVDSSVPSSIQITDLLINDKPTLAYGNPGELKELVLEFANNTIQFNISTIDFSDIQSCIISCKLEGIDKDWVVLKNPGLIRYPNLPHDKFVFIIRSTNSDGVWNKNEKRISITILPPWYRTNLFYITCVLIVMGASFAYYRYRIKLVRMQEKMKLQIMVSTQEDERRRMARDLHDDVGAQLSTVKLFLSSLTNAPREDEQKLKEQSLQLINSSIDDIRNILINLSPKSLDEHGYVVAVEELVNKINQSNALAFHLTLFGMNERLERNIEVSIFRITQELINNTLKHANAKGVWLDVTMRDRKIILSYEDDGKGFETSLQPSPTERENVGSGFGMKNIQSRVEMLHGILNFDTQPGKGMRAQIEIPL